MKYTFFKLNTILLTIFALAFASCDDDENTPIIPLDAEEVEDLAADPTQNPDLSSRATTNKFTLFSFKDNAVISNSDSATTKWDIGFRNTALIINNGTSGPGQTQAQIVDGIFDELFEAPEGGYSYDAEGTYALPGSEWYNYTGPTGNPAHAIIPIPGKTIVIKTSDGNYAKMEILSYYYGNPDTSTTEFANLGTRPPSRYFTFRFIYQPDESRNLKDNK